MPSAGIAPRRAVQLAALFAMMVAFTAQFVGALLPVIPLFIAASVVNLGLDLVLQHKQPGLLAVLGRIRFDVTVRQLLRDMLILVGLLHIDGINPLEEQAPLTITLLLFYGTHFVCQAVAVLVRRTRSTAVRDPQHRRERAAAVATPRRASSPARRAGGCCASRCPPRSA